MLQLVFKPAQKRASPSEGRNLGKRTEPESAKDLRSQAGASGGAKGRGSEQIQVWSKRRGRKPFGPSARHGREFPERDTEGWNGEDGRRIPSRSFQKDLVVWGLICIIGEMFLFTTDPVIAQQMVTFRGSSEEVDLNSLDQDKVPYYMDLGLGFDKVDPALVQLFAAFAVLLISLFAVYDSVRRTNCLAGVRGVAEEPWNGVFIAYFYSVGVIVSWWLWVEFGIFKTSEEDPGLLIYNDDLTEKLASSFIGRALEFPHLLAPGVWLAAVVPAAFALHYFVLLGFDHGTVNTGSDVEKSEKSEKPSTPRPQVVPTFQMIYTFTAFTASLVKILSFFMGSGASSD